MVNLPLKIPASKFSAQNVAQKVQREFHSAKYSNEKRPNAAVRLPAKII
jgi:hypothetical protein